MRSHVKVVTDRFIDLRTTVTSLAFVPTLLAIIAVGMLVLTAGFFVGLVAWIT